VFGHDPTHYAIILVQGLDIIRYDYARCASGSKSYFPSLPQSHMITNLALVRFSCFSHREIPSYMAGTEGKKGPDAFFPS
jgi:hypothetical protein